MKRFSILYSIEDKETNEMAASRTGNGTTTSRRLEFSCPELVITVYIDVKYYTKDHPRILSRIIERHNRISANKYYVDVEEFLKDIKNSIEDIVVSMQEPLVTSRN